MSIEPTSTDRILHVAVVYYLHDGSKDRHVLYDSSDTWRDPPRVLLARAERAEARVRELEREIGGLRGA
jgi:hypothetical protein